MRAREKIYLSFIATFLVLYAFILIPNVSAPPPPPMPDQFIAEIYPNSTTPLQLSYTNTIVNFDATDLSNKIDIHFDANYTISNQENKTTLDLILPFSLAINITEVIIEVFANNSPITYDLISFTNKDEIVTPINIQLEWFRDVYPIILIKSNVTLPKNSTTVLRYLLSGSNDNPFDLKDLVYHVYHVGTSEEWMGNTTGRVELRVYGTKYHFSMSSIRSAPSQVIDFTGGKSYICDWNNTLTPIMDVGVQFYRETSFFEEWLELFAFVFPLSITNIGVIIIILIKRSERKKR